MPRIVWFHFNPSPIISISSILNLLKEISKWRSHSFYCTAYANSSAQWGVWLPREFQDRLRSVILRLSFRPSKIFLPPTPRMLLYYKSRFTTYLLESIMFEILLHAKSVILLWDTFKLCSVLFSATASNNNETLR